MAKMIRKSTSYSIVMNRKGYQADKKEFLAMNWKERTKARADNK